jgi:hypothetical protein
MARHRRLVGGVALLLAFASCIEADPINISAEDTQLPTSSVAGTEPSTSAAGQSEPSTSAAGETASPTSSAGSISPDAVTWAPIDESPVPAGGTMVPLQMYYIERYLADVPDKTDTDLAIAAILDESPETREFLVGALESYRAMPESVKEERFDPDAVRTLASYTDTFEVSALLELVDPTSVILGLIALESPLAPTDLVAENSSRPGSMEQDPTGGGGYDTDPTHGVTLTWQDNAFNEDGFRIYRWPYPTLAGVAPNLLDTVGPDSRSFEDRLPEPPSVDEMVCYQVTAYRDTPLDPESPFVESPPTEAVCLEYHWTKVDLGIDTGDDDDDGYINAHDECPQHHHNGARSAPLGWPDADGDGWEDGVDQCPSERGEHRYLGFSSGRTPYEAPPGCPQRFGVNWMSLRAVNNSVAYSHGVNNLVTPDGKWAFLTMNEVDDREGEEPYLIFEWVNGWSDTGDHQTGQAKWCCGEGIDVAAGDIVEPDGTTLAEGDQDLDRAVREHGLVVFPPGDISKTPGLLITAILMEMDWTAWIRPESADTALDLLETAGEAALVIGGCIASAGIGCLLDIGEAIVEGFVSIFAYSPPRIEVEDPDDVMGDAVWVMTHREALSLTAGDGAHGFSFEVPFENGAVCLDGASPCPIEIAVPSRLAVVVEMCLYREGVPAGDLRTLCAPYPRVEPWPMRVPR